MNISSSQISTGITSISNSNSVTKQLFQNRNIFTGESVGDSVDISSQGMMMSKMMASMKTIDPNKMAEEIDSLGLENLDVDTMSREELESTMSKIQEMMEVLKPESAQGKNLNFEDMSDDELRGLITRFSDKLKQIESGIGR